MNILRCSRKSMRLGNVFGTGRDREEEQSPLDRNIRCPATLDNTPWLEYCIRRCGFHHREKSPDLSASPGCSWLSTRCLLVTRSRKKNHQVAGEAVAGAGAAVAPPGLANFWDSDPL